jgi:hypothetical protein
VVLDLLAPGAVLLALQQGNQRTQSLFESP